jgi:hypothetical protein
MIATKKNRIETYFLQARLREKEAEVEELRELEAQTRS